MFDWLLLRTGIGDHRLAWRSGCICGCVPHLQPVVRGVRTVLVEAGSEPGGVAAVSVPAAPVIRHDRQPLRPQREGGVQAAAVWVQHVAVVGVTAGACGLAAASDGQQLPPGPWVGLGAGEPGAGGGRGSVSSSSCSVALYWVDMNEM